MGERLVAWRSKPSESVVQSIRSLARKRIYLLQQPGPTCFVVQEEDGKEKIKVLIGSKVTCSACKKDNGEVCIHTLFVMLKVIGVPPSNPLVWQGSLLDRELDELIQCGNRMGKRKNKTSGSGKGSTEPSKKKKEGGAPKEIQPDDRCPICFETLFGAKEQELLSCSSCGNQLHGRCIYVWARHQESLDRNVTCPLCRGDWGEVKWSRAYACDRRGVPTTTNTRDRNKETHYGSSCGKCSKAPLQGKRYSCVICRHFDLCQECFDAGVHAVHPFNMIEKPGAEPEFAPRAEADLENFEFRAPKCSTASGSGSTSKSRTGARPLKERTIARENNSNGNEGRLTQQSSPTLTQNSKGTTDGEGEGGGGGVFPDFGSLSLMGTSVKMKSTPKVSRRFTPRGGRKSNLSRGGNSRNFSLTSSSKQMDNGGGHSADPDASANSGDPFSLTGLGLGIVGQSTSTLRR